MAKAAKKAERKGKLKVFRTPIGFHDAYVAAPSQKAALEAWGADGNLFAQGIAEQVRDPKLMEEALDRPGEIIRKVRGSADEHFAALDRVAKRRDKSDAKAPKKTASAPKVTKPSRDELDVAEEAINAAKVRQKSEVKEIDREIGALERKRRDLLRRHERERDSLTEERDAARSSYERAMRAWEKGR
jgi:small-conductance mechanosensitive channel